MNAREKHYYVEGRRANRCVFCGKPPENSAHFPPASDADADAIVCAHAVQRMAGKYMVTMQELDASQRILGGTDE